MSKNKGRALIIGGGIGGPLLALLLQRNGFAPEVFEASESPGSAGGGLGLAANGMNVLAAAGLDEAVREVSVTTGDARFENQQGKLLALLPAAGLARYGQSGVMITRAALHQVLLDRARLEGVPVHFNKAFTALHDVPGDPVTISFRDGTSAEGDFVVGSDGIRSQVRQVILPHAPPPEYTGLAAPGGFSPCLGSNMTPRSKQEVHFIFGQNGFFGHFNVVTSNGPRTLWWSTATSPLSSRDRGTVSHRDLRRRLLTLHGNWANPVPRLIESATELIDVNIHDVPSIPCWSARRTVLIGDAAHAVAPHSGQGASMALEDAQLLAKLLRDAPQGDYQAVFERFERERRPRTDRVIALGRRNGRRKESMSPVSYWIQQQMIRIFVPLTRIKRQDWLLSYKVE